MEFSASWAQIWASVLGIAGSGMGTIVWFLFQSVRSDAKAAKSDIEALNKELAAHRLYVAEHYVTQNDLTKAISSLERSIELLIRTVENNSKETRDGFGQLYERLDKKADK